MEQSVVEYLFLNEAITSSGLSQKEICDILDISETYLSLLHGRKKPISKKIVRNLAKIYPGGFEAYWHHLEVSKFNQVLSTIKNDPIALNALVGYVKIIKGKTNANGN